MIKSEDGAIPPDLRAKGILLGIVIAIGAFAAMTFGLVWAILSSSASEEGKGVALLIYLPSLGLFLVTSAFAGLWLSHLYVRRRRRFDS